MYGGEFGLFSGLPIGLHASGEKIFDTVSGPWQRHLSFPPDIINGMLQRI